ncbi:MAG TPA: hypothetical protein VGH55_07950 [Chthoniobacterales bacterium]
MNAPRVTTGDFLILAKTNYIKPIGHSRSLRLFFLQVKRSVKRGASHPDASLMRPPETPAVFILFLDWQVK